MQYPGKAHPRYECRQQRHEGLPRCIGFTAPPIDRAVVRELWRVIEPAAIEAARCARDQHHEQACEGHRLLELELQAAQYEVARAKRQYEAVDPDNRLVAAELEARWNATLVHERDLQQHLEELSSAPPPAADLVLDPLALADDLRRLWHHPEADVPVRKRILRTLVEEIVVDLDREANEVELTLHWKGGLHSALRVPRPRPGQKLTDTPDDVVDAVRVLVRVCSDDTIAAALNRNGSTTGHGHPWTRPRVCALRSKRAIPVHDPRVKQEQGWMNLGEAAAYLRVTSKTLRRAARRSQLRAEQPLSRGPWVFQRVDLDEYRCRLHQSTPEDLSVKQLNLINSSTYREDAL